MTQNGKVLTREADPVSLMSRRVATLEDDPVYSERRIAMTTAQQKWTLQVAQRIPVSDIMPERVNPLLKIANRLSRLGIGRIDVGHLESKQNIGYNPGIRGIGL